MRGAAEWRPVSATAARRAARQDYASDTASPATLSVAAPAWAAYLSTAPPALRPGGSPFQ